MSKGSKRRPIDPKLERKVFEDNWDRIFNKNKADLNYESDNPLERPFEPKELDETSKEEGSRESVGSKYSESYKLTERQNSDFQKGSMQYSEHSVQYHPPSENH